MSTVREEEPGPWIEEGGAPMSKRHAASRRRTYGRRQHELHERLDRRADRGRSERSWRSENESVAFIDAPAGDAPYGFAD
jgi:hypothetical protein